MRAPIAGGSSLALLLFVGLSLALASYAAASAHAAEEEDPWANAEVLGEENAGASSDAEGAEAEANGDVWEGVEAILVESQRRMVDLQDASESITSFSEDDLTGRGLVNFQDLQYSVPNLFTGGGLSRTTLRGVGSEIVGPGTDPGFAVHVNGVYTARSGTGNADYFDIERVDVLRGPQGTLWGRNSTGGAINIVTARPKFEFGSEADIDYESFTEGASAYRLRAVLNMPIIDETLAARVAFLGYINDGISRNDSATRSQRVNDAETYSLRGSLRWQPNERLTVDYIGSFLSQTGAGQTPKFSGPFFSPGGFVPAGAGPGADYTGALPNPDNPYRGTSDTRSHVDTTLFTSTLLVDWEGDAVKLQSITGYQATNFETRRDLDGSSLPIATIDLEDKSRQVSQELLVHSSWERPFDYTIGAIYQYDWTPHTRVNIENSQNTALATNFRLFPFIITNSFIDGCGLLTPAACPPIKQPGQTREDFIRAFSKVDNHVLGLYANVSWEVVDDFRLSTGARYSYTHRKWNDQSVVQTFAATGVTSGLQVLQLGKKLDHSWQSGTWKITADYRVFEDHLLWASVGTGARAGGFNFIDEQHFDQEEIFAVEGGFKSSFLDRRLTLNVTGFWYDWQDPQIRGTADNIPLTTNAPSAESYGIEVEGRLVVTPELILDGSFGWLEATYDRSFSDFERTTPDYSAPIESRSPLVDIEGNRLPRSPRFSVSAGAQYTHDFDDWGTLTPRVDFYYRAETSFRQFDNHLDEQEAYTRTDIRLTWKSLSERFRLELFMRNLENNAVKTNQEVFENIYRLHYYDTPRSGGIRIGYDY